MALELQVGTILEGKVTGVKKFGAFVSLPDQKTGMVHISEVSSSFIEDLSTVLTEGQTVKVKVMNIAEDGKIALSMKRALPAPPRSSGSGPRQQRPGRPGNYEWQSRRNEGGTFEEMMSRFKQTSDEKMSDLTRTMESKRGGFSRHGGSQK